MMTGKPCFVTIFAAFLIASASPAPAQEGPTAWTARTDWEKAHLILSVESSVPRSGANLPAADLAADRRIARELPAIFAEASRPVLVDSRHTVGDRAEKDPALGADILQAAEAGLKGLPVNSRDLRKVVVDYTYPLREVLGPLFVRHLLPRKTPPQPGWRPTKEYTGLVIYAKGPLPVHGEDAPARLRPCLFPEIFDDGMEPVMLTGMGNPDFLKKWGGAAYTAALDEGPWRDRIGGEPFRIIATKLFGRYPTDPVIPREDAESFLASPSAGRIIPEGRVLLICHLE